MPILAKRRLPQLSAAEVQNVLSVASIRDKAIISFMVDTGLRRSEVVALDWRHVDMSNGLVTVARGKGGKSRSAVLGITGRRALLAYRRTLSGVTDNSPLFQTDENERFSVDGFRSLFTRLSKKSGVKFSAHALRRSFCILSLRAGMSPTTVQALMGHSTITMTMHYAQMVDDDLLQGHSEHSPLDNLKTLAKK